MNLFMMNKLMRILIIKFSFVQLKCNSIPEQDAEYTTSETDLNLDMNLYLSV